MWCTRHWRHSAGQEIFHRVSFLLSWGKSWIHHCCISIYYVQAVWRVCEPRRPFFGIGWNYSIRGHLSSETTSPWRSQFGCTSSFLVHSTLSQIWSSYHSVMYDQKPLFMATILYFTCQRPLRYINWKRMEQEYCQA